MGSLLTEIVILPANGVEGLARWALPPARPDGPKRHKTKRHKVVEIDLLAQAVFTQLENCRDCTAGQRWSRATACLLS